MPVYSIAYRKRALKEYVEATTWYEARSLQIAESFVSTINDILKAVSEHPHSFRNPYKHFYEVKAKRFPFSVIYFINESKHQVVITTLFHQKRNSDIKFR